MSTSQCVGAHDIARENLTSPTDQPAEQSALPPFSGKLSVDKELKLSNETFKQTIEVVLEDKDITPVSQLTATPAFPTPYVLAQFASKAYTNYNRQETDAQYETRLALPDGWKLLTTASNTRSNNGYYGAAYWHPEHQQVVIAHRGTELTNVGAIFINVFGVLFKHHVRQMGSASTFAHKVVEVLREVNHKKGTNFQVFFTGHSLGGWLAQITTFTTKYLKVEGDTFLQSGNVPHSYHPHTVVFDSPGCKDMLSQMAATFDVRYDGRSIYSEHLDITSYLSAPNLINTCNAHLGTIYRVFTDLSDMRWLEQHTPIYNLAAHSMDKIVKVFDPETGQVFRDEQGKLKVHVVIDWPICGFRRDEEYTSFFKWAKQFNNYHPDITDYMLPLEGYHPIRYQTKNYDERVTSISIFSQEERQFLESYLWLHQLPEFLKPKELFCAMKNNEAQEEAVKMLQHFEIQNDTIRCTDASALQSLIPYVKRLLQLFPQIQGKIKSVLSSHEIRNKVYQLETRRYIEQINQRPLDFKAGDLSLGDFLRSDQQQVLQLHMSDGDEWTGLVKVYQVLQKTDCLSEGQYTVMKLKRLLALNNLIDFGALIKSTDTTYLILVACGANQLLNGEEEDIIRTLFNTIKQKPSIKFIFSTRSEDSTCTFLQHECSKIFGNGFVRRDEQLTWNDITTSSLEKLLEKTVSFQGANIALNKLIPADSALADLLPLVALLEGKQINIGNPLPISNAYNEVYYIGRTFRHQIVIKKKICSDEHEKKFPDLIVSTEKEFKKLCQQNPKSNVHWLESDMSGKLCWLQSHGSLKALRKYIDTHSAHTYTADDLVKRLEQAQHHRVMLISDTAGMGKSTVLTHLSKQIKQKFPAKWVVRIDLNDHTNALQALKKGQINKEKAIEFVSEKLLELEPGLEIELFKQCCEQKQNVDIVIMLDGFDKISPSYKDTVIALLQALRQTAVEQLWVTTRPHLREELEDELQQLSYTLEPFTEENQVEFLTKFWSLTDWFTEMDSKGKEEKKVKLEIYAEHLIKKLAQSISDKDKEFTGIPLQCRMLAEAFEEEVKTFSQSAESVPELPFKLNLLGLYERFMNKKYRVCLEETFNISLKNVGAEALRKQFLTTIIQDHQILALKTLFAEEKVALLQINSQCTSTDEDITRIGIVQVSDDGKLHFIHRTFAEYYVAKFSVNQLTKRYNTSQQVQDLLLQKIFLEEDYRVIRIFIDGLLSRSEPSQEVLKQYGNRISDLWGYGLLTLHQSALEGNAYIIGFFLESLQAGQHTDIVYELLLAKGVDGDSAWHVAAKGRQPQVLQKLWEWGKATLTAEELRNKLLLAKDCKENTAWQYAVWQSNLEVLQKLWEWGKETLTAEELSNKLLLAKDNMEQTAWHYASQRYNAEALQKLWDWGTETLTAEELSNKLLLAKNNKERTAWHYASHSDNVEVLQKLWEWGKETLTAEELCNKVLLAKDNKERTAWHFAALKGSVELLQKLWEWGKETLTAEELCNKLLLAKDNKERIAWHFAALKGSVELLQKLWEWGEETLTAEELRNKLLLAKDNEERTAWHYASIGGNVQVLEMLWELGKVTLTAEELNNNLLLSKNNMGKTAWHLAAEEGNQEALQKLWECGNEKLTEEELCNKFLLAKDYDERTAWHLAANKSNLEVKQDLWEWAVEKLTAEELNNNFSFAKDNIEQTAWHLAAKKANTAVLE